MLRPLSRKALTQIDDKTWSVCCRHVRDREAEKWKSDIAVEQEIEKIVIQIDTDSRMKKAMLLRRRRQKTQPGRRVRLWTQP